MAKHPRTKRPRLYVGVDVGGTKIQASLAGEDGEVRRRVRRPTPRRGHADDALAAIEGTIQDLLREEGLGAGDLEAVGVAVPGVVDTAKGLVVVTPNMNLSGAKVGGRLERRLGVTVALGNDCNLGILGEAWRGAAVGVESAFGIFVGTGIGGGFVQDGRLWRGARDAAAEIGHIVMEIGGPVCGCGNRGCLEALASRTAIERDLRAAMKAGRRTVLAKMLKSGRGPIRSGVLRDALAQGDRLVTEVLRRAAEVLGHACLTVRHLVDPEVIVLGGGVVEACGALVVPIVRGIVEGDRLSSARPGAPGVVESALGDDAVAVGAVALARQAVGRSPFMAASCARPAALCGGSRDIFDFGFSIFDLAPEANGPGPLPFNRKSQNRKSKMPSWVEATPGRVTVGGQTYTRSIYIRASGKVKKFKGAAAAGAAPGVCPAAIGPDELRKVCKGRPAVLFLGTGPGGRPGLARAAAAYAKERGIEVRSAPTAEAARAYNACPRRKAALLCIGP